jgi:hypothetical protein
MIRRLLRILSRWLLLLPLLLVASSAKLYLEMEPVRGAAITVTATQVDDPGIVTNAPLTFVRGWTLTSDDVNFGGVSAMFRDEGGFIAITDAGAVLSFRMDAAGRVSGARTAPLPVGCAPDRMKPSLDAESLARDPVSGEVLIAFEWRHAICRADAGLKKSVGITNPTSMRRWPFNSGAEAMVALADGRTIVFAESGQAETADSPALIFDGDPADPATPAKAFRYRPPAGFRPTDAAQSPDGRVIIVNRRYEFPLTFSALLTIVDADAIIAGATVEGKVVARIEPPGVADNFEAIAVSQGRGRSFVWLMSDDNFIAYQQTYLLLFEVMR